MKKFLMVLALVITVQLSGPTQKAEALIVYDPTNYAANIQTSLKQVESVINELKMLENQAKNLASLGQVAELSQLKNTFSQLMALKSQVDGLLGGFENYQSEWDKVFKDFATVNGMSGTQYASHAKAQLDALSKAAYEATRQQLKVKDTVDTDAEALEALLRASESTTGALQAAQAGNQIGGAIVQQLLKLQTTMAASNAAQLSYTNYLMDKDKQAAARAQKFFETTQTP